MSPLLVYGALLLGPLIIAVALRYVIVVPMRDCIQCGKTVAVTALWCRHCGHRYTAEDRELMRLQTERRSAEFERAGIPARAAAAPAAGSRPLSGVPRMPCVRCEGEVAVTALSCRHCGHLFTPAERERMRLSSTLRPGGARPRA
jgi:ribosomal protein L40E